MGGSSSSHADTSTSNASQTTTTNTQQTTSTNTQLTGGSGEGANTVNAGGPVTIQNAGGEVSLAALSGMGNTTLNALSGMGDVVKAAINQAGDTSNQSLQILSDFAARQVDANTQQSQNDTGLLSSILASNSQLAQNSQTGGATAAIQSTNYIIWGLLGLAGLALVFFIFRK